MNCQKDAPASLSLFAYFTVLFTSGNTLHLTRNGTRHTFLAARDDVRNQLPLNPEGMLHNDLSLAIP